MIRTITHNRLIWERQRGWKFVEKLSEKSREKLKAEQEAHPQEIADAAVRAHKAGNMKAAKVLRDKYRFPRQPLPTRILRGGSTLEVELRESPIRILKGVSTFEVEVRNPWRRGSIR